jgi:hypothetical protein
MHNLIDFMRGTLGLLVGVAHVAALYWNFYTFRFACMSSNKDSFME